MTEADIDRQVGSLQEVKPNARRPDLPPDDIANFLIDIYPPEPDKWTDPVWGYAQIDQSWGGENLKPEHEGYDYPQMFEELMLHPTIRRTLGVEQLTLPPRYATIPNAAHFSRFEHITGSALLVKKLIDDWDKGNPDDPVDGRAKTIYILRTLFSDIGHTIGSHLGDWIAGDHTEKAHDEVLNDYVVKTGLADLLAKYGIEAREVILTEIDEHDFVEKPSPDLCIDRVDYAVREMHRWNRFFDDPDKQITIEDFTLIKDENGALQMVMKDPKKALMFAKGYELLAKEDWSEPLQRLQTVLYTDFIKLILAGVCNGYIATPVGRTEVKPVHDSRLRDEWIDEWDRNPRDILMYTESAITQTVDDVKYLSEIYPDNKFYQAVATMDELMRSVSLVAKADWKNRALEVHDFMKGIDNGVLPPDSQIAKRSDIRESVSESSAIKQIVITEVPEPGAPEDALTLELPSRKQRKIDPKVMHDSRLMQLSEIELESGFYEPHEGVYPKLSARLDLKSGKYAQAMLYAKKFLQEHWNKELLDRPMIVSGQLQDLQKGVLSYQIGSGDYVQFVQEPCLLAREKDKQIEELARMMSGVALKSG